MRHPKLNVESLEARTTPAAFGTPWPDAEHLTISFAPDGTDVGGTPSSLFADLGADALDWRAEILRAYQTWAAHADINLGVVADQGAEFGGFAPPQGSSVAGDIRIAARPLSADELAVAAPFDWFSGWSGDVMINSAYDFSTDGGTVDLFSVILHEAGHSLGLGHDDDPNSAMHASHHGGGAELSGGDVSRLQALYGERTADGHEGLFGNGSRFLATPVVFVDQAGELGQRIRADLTTAGDLDYYRVTTPWGTRGFDVSLRTTGLSLLTAEVTVTDSWGRVVASESSTDPLSGDLRLSVPGGGWLPQTYYVRVAGASGDVFDIGAYELAVGTRALEATHPDTPHVMRDVLGGDLPWLATSLLSTTVRFGDHWEYTGRAGFDRVGDVDWFAISPPLDAHAQTMAVTAWGLDGSGVRPVIEVYDLFGNRIDAELISDNAGVYTIQFGGAGGLLDKYFVCLSADTSDGGSAVGNYFLGVDFRDEAVPLETVAEGTLSPVNTADYGTFTLERAGLIHFVLDAMGEAGSVIVEVRGEDGEVYSLTVAAGESSSWDLVLDPGVYHVRFRSLGDPDEIAYRLRAAERTDPVGPQTVDPTEDTSESPADNPPPQGGSSGGYWWSPGDPGQEEDDWLAASESPSAPAQGY